MRYQQINIVLKVFVVILTLWLFRLQIISGNYYYNLSKRNIIRVVPLEAARGKIIDRNGVVLVDTAASFNISVVPQEIKDKTRLFNKLSELLELPVDKINKNYNKNYLSPFAPVKICERLNKDKIISIEENKAQLPGVLIDIEPQRVYPFNKTASNVLGYLGQIDLSGITKLKPYGYQLTDLIGYSGLEKYYDLFLRGIKGGEQIEVDNKGKRVRIVGYKPARPGEDIKITIDIRIQQIVDKFMQDKKGAIVIMDPFSGEIIALNSSPDYNPNDFVKRNDGKVEGVLKDARSPLFNRAISGQYPAGSVFKIATAIAALDRDPALINKSFFCDGSMQIGTDSYNCSSKHQDEDLKDAMIHSCNIYFYNLGIIAGPEAINKYAHFLGLGQLTGIDLNYEVKGFIPSPNWKKIVKFQGWYKGDTVNMAIGQGEILVTPIQAARMVSILANGAKLVTPHLVKEIGGRKVKAGADKIIKLKNKDTLKNISNYLFGVINDPEGTAHIVKVEGLKIYGKTGTAQVSGKQPHGWIAGYAGRGSPKYAFCIFLENCGSSYFASLTAKSILEEMLKEDLI